MRTIIGFLVLGMLVSACNESGDSTERKLDSLERRIDTTAEKVWDSTKARAKDLKEQIEEKFEERDSANRTDTVK
jgi:hypothetical protein